MVDGYSIVLLICSIKQGKMTFSLFSLKAYAYLRQWAFVIITAAPSKFHKRGLFTWGGSWKMYPMERIRWETNLDVSLLPFSSVLILCQVSELFQTPKFRPSDRRVVHIPNPFLKIHWHVNLSLSPNGLPVRTLGRRTSQSSLWGPVSRTFEIQS